MDISCRWKIDDSLLFSVCVLWFVALVQRIQTMHSLEIGITGVNSAQRIIHAVRIHTDQVISA